jgi:hypothetical protein
MGTFAAVNRNVLHEVLATLSVTKRCNRWINEMCVWGRKEGTKERCLSMLRAWVVSGGKRTNSYLIV